MKNQTFLSKGSNKPIRVIFYTEYNHPGYWFAQALEHNVFARGTDLDDLKINFELTLELEAKLAGGLKNIPPAPQKFHNMWDERETNFELTNPESVTYRIAA